ncbi:MAG: response regulator transcription factor [Clostridia bacterium]|nr:response regulator transcription factor [Clostridia bacterium]
MKGVVYVLEDDASIGGLIKFSLEREGIVCHTFPCVKDFETAIGEKTPDLALLDIMLPDGNGFEVLQRLKARFPHTGCIMISALGQEADKVMGLNLGADDYIAKPFGVMELVARVKAHLRRLGGDSVLTVGDIELRTDTMTVTLKGKPLELNRKEFELLKYCMQNADIVLPRDTLLNEIWGYVDAETRTLDNHIARLRKMGVENFETVFGVGYRFKKQ